MKKLKKPISVLLALCMFISAISVGLTVFAENFVTSQESTTENTTAEDYSNAISDIEKAQTDAQNETQSDNQIQGEAEVQTQQEPQEEAQPQASQKNDSKESEKPFVDFNTSFREMGIPVPNMLLWSSDKNNGPSNDPAVFSRTKAIDTFITLILENYDFINSKMSAMTGDYWRNQANYKVTDDTNYTFAQLMQLYYTFYSYWRAYVNNFNNSDNTWHSFFITQGGWNDIDAAMAAKIAENGGTYTTKGGTALTAEALNIGSAKGNFITSSATAIRKMILLFEGYQNSGNVFDNETNTNAKPFAVFAPTDKSYLLFYPTLEQIPDRVMTQTGVYVQNSSRKVLWNTYYKVSDNYTGITANNYDPMVYASTTGVTDNNGDTTSKTALKNFVAFFTPDILNTNDVADFTPKQMTEIIGAGQGIVDTLNGFSADVTAKFLADSAHTFVGNPVDRAKEIIAKIHIEISAKYVEIVNEANALYGTKVLTVDDIDALDEMLLNAGAYYDVMTAEAKGAADIVNAKAIFDMLLVKKVASEEAFYTAAYSQYIAELIIKLKSDFVALNLVDPTVDENMNGIIAGVMATYLEVVKRLITIQPELNTNNAQAVQILADIKSRNLFTEDELVKYDVANKIFLLGAKNETASTGSVSYNATNNPLLYVYNSISQIPQSFEYKKSSLVYKYVDGLIKNREDIVVEETILTNTTAFVDFNLWKSTFNNDVMTVDLATLDLVTLQKLVTDFNTAFDKILPYSQQTKDHLLGGTDVTFASAQERLLEVQSAVANLFVKQYEEIWEKFSSLVGTDLTIAQAEDFILLKTIALSTYEAIDTANKARQDVANAYTDLIGMNFKFETWRMENYIKEAEKLNKYVSDMGEKEISQQTKTEVQQIINTMNEKHSHLTDAQKADANVILWEATKNAYQALIDATYDAPVWTETNVDMTNVPNLKNADDALAIAKTLDGVINSDLITNALGLEEGENIGTIIWDMISENAFSASMITEICKAIYPMLGTELMKNEGYIWEGKVSRADLVKYTFISYTPYYLLENSCFDSKYKNVFDEVTRMSNANISTYNEGDTDWSKWDWVDYTDPANPVPVHDYDTFIAALSSALAPIWTLIPTMLFELTTKVLGLVTVFEGKAGYRNVIEPFYKQLGCENIPSYDTLKGKATISNANHTRQKATDTLPLLLEPLKNRILSFGESPVKDVLTILPQLSYIINNDWLTTAIEIIGQPLEAKKFYLISMLTNAGIDLKDMNKLISDFTGNIEISGEKLNIPYINFGAIAGIATKNGNGFSPIDPYKTYGAQLTTKYDEMLVYFLDFVLGIARDNKPIIDQLIADLLAKDPTLPGEQIKGLVEQIFTNSNDEIINTLCGLFVNVPDTADVDWDMSEWNHEKKSAKYEDGVNSAQTAQAVAQLDEVIKLVVGSFLETDLSGYVGGMIYTDKNLNDLVMTIYRKLGTDANMPLFNTLGIDISTTAVGNALSAYPDISTLLLQADGWQNVNTTDCKWNLTDSDSFALALSRILAPFNGILKALLADADYALLDNSYVVKGANGYANSVLPILNALGCPNILTPEQYSAGVNGDNGDDMILFSIISPVLKYMDKILASPVGTLANMLPNFAYFMDNGGLTKAFTALIAPLTNILDVAMNLFKVDGVAPTALDFAINTILPILKIELPFEVELNNIEGTITNAVQHAISITPITIGDVQYTLTVEPIDWGQLAGHGKLERDGSMWERLTTLGSDDPSIYRVLADTGDSAMAVLNYIFTVLRANSNMAVAAVDKFVGNVEGINVADYLTLMLQNPAPKLSSALVRTINGGSKKTEFNWGTLVKQATSFVYPDGVTENQLNSAVNTADTAIRNALAAFANISLSSVISSTIYTNANINAIVKGLYQAVGSVDVMPILEMLGTDFSQQNVAAQLADYPTAVGAITSVDSWSKVDFPSINWNVSDKASFAKALATALRPFGSLLNMLLVGDTVDVLGMYSISGADGYKNAILPMLTALGCNESDGLLSANAYRSSTYGSQDAAIMNIINPVLNLVDRLANAPIGTLTSILPNFAYFLSNGGVKKSIEALILPITNIAEPIISLVSSSSVGDFALGLFGGKLPIDVNNIDSSIVPMINSLIASTGIQLPAIDWATLASHGTVKSRNLSNSSMSNFADVYVEANVAETTTALIRYIASLLTYGNNLAGIKTLVAPLKIDILNEIISNLASAKPDDIVKMIADLLAPKDSNPVAKWSYRNLKSVVTTYTPNLVEKDFSDAITILDSMIPELLSGIDGVGSLGNLLSSNVYTPAMMTTIFKAIAGISVIGATDTSPGTDIFDILKKVGIDMTPAGVAANLNESKFISLSDTLNNAGAKWNDVNFDNINWGFKTGSESDFLATLAAMLRPLSGVLGAILNGEDLVLLDSITVKGANGYSNAIVPLLEALGCENVVSVAKYKKDAQANPDNLILSIAKPLFGAINSLAQNPVDALCSLLPNVAYFMYNDGAAQLADALILPVTKLLNTIEPAYSFNLDLSIISDFDLMKTVNGIISGIEINGQKVGIRLLDFKWEQLAGRGSLESYKSQRVNANGTRMTAKRVAADKPAVLLTVLRYIVDNLQEPNNLESIKKLIAGFNLGDMASVIGMVLDMLATSDRDEIIEFIFELLLGIGGGKRDEPIVENVNNPVVQNVEKEKSKLPLIIGLSVAGAVLVGGGLTLLLLKKKKAAALANSI